MFKFKHEYPTYNQVLLSNVKKAIKNLRNGDSVSITLNSLEDVAVIIRKYPRLHYYISNVSDSHEIGLKKDSYPRGIIVEDSGLPIAGNFLCHRYCDTTGNSFIVLSLHQFTSEVVILRITRDNHRSIRPRPIGKLRLPAM